MRFILRRSSLVECVSVLHGTGVYKASIFFLRQYVQPCLLKNPKYTFYTKRARLSSHIKRHQMSIKIGTGYDYLDLPGIGNNNEKLGLLERLSAGIEFRFRNLFHGKISGNRNYLLILFKLMFSSENLCWQVYNQIIVCNCLLCLR